MVLILSSIVCDVTRLSLYSRSIQRTKYRPKMAYKVIISKPTLLLCIFSSKMKKKKKFLNEVAFHTWKLCSILFHKHNCWQYSLASHNRTFFWSKTLQMYQLTYTHYRCATLITLNLVRWALVTQSDCVFSYNIED